MLRVERARSLLHMGQTGYISTTHQSLLHSTLSITVHFNGLNGTAYIRPLTVQYTYALGCLVFGTFLGWCGQSLEYFIDTKKYLRNPKESSSYLEASFWPEEKQLVCRTASIQKVLQLPVLREPMGRIDTKVNYLTKKYCP